MDYITYHTFTALHHALTAIIIITKIARYYRYFTTYRYYLPFPYQKILDQKLLNCLPKISVIRLVHFLVKLYAFQHFMTTYFYVRGPFIFYRPTQIISNTYIHLYALYYLYLFICSIYPIYDLYQWMIDHKLLSKFLL